MRKEIFNHEINILRDTYRRLLRRNAKINLIKLTGKTHPADLAEVFRHFSNEEQIEIFSLMKEDEHTADFSIDYIKIKELALKKKKLDAVQDWMRDKIKSTYISISAEYRSCNSQYNWINK